MGNLMRTCLLLSAALGFHAATTTTTKTTTTTTTPAGVVVSASKIIDGATVPITSYPYQLSYRLGSSHVCGASIISANWALTSAQCITNPGSEASLRAGSTNRRTGGTIHVVNRTVIHELYNAGLTDYDMALLQVRTPFKLGTPGVAAIALPAVNATVQLNAIGTVTGWGYNVSGGPIRPNLLQAGKVPMITDAACIKIWKNVRPVTPRMICAGGAPKDTAGSCAGDTGGPLMVVSPTGIKQLIGVVSWGFVCSNPKYPNAYARVANMRAWIKTVSKV